MFKKMIFGRGEGRVRVRFLCVLFVGGALRDVVVLT